MLSLSELCGYVVVVDEAKLSAAACACKVISTCPGTLIDADMLHTIEDFCGSYCVCQLQFSL